MSPASFEKNTQQKLVVTHGQRLPGLPAQFLWFTLLVGPLSIACANQDVIPLLAIFLAQELLKQVKSHHKDARTFGVVSADLVLIRFERVSPNLKFGLDGTFLSFCDALWSLFVPWPLVAWV